MQKLKLMTIIGTRPEIIRLAPTIKCADKYFDHIFPFSLIFFRRIKNSIF